MKIVINYSDVLTTVSINQGKPCDEKPAYIRDCFDWLFYRIDRLEHYIRRCLIQFEDVRDVFKVYAREVESHEDVFNDFLRFHEYNMAREFFSRFKQGSEHQAKSPTRSGRLVRIWRYAVKPAADKS